MNNYKNSNDGFTLIEMMVTVAIVGIFASIALPSFSSLIESNRITTATNELVSNLLLAKSEALKRSQDVTLCASSNQTSCAANTDYSTGWIIFLDCDDDDTAEETVANCGTNGIEEMIKVHDGFDSLSMDNTSTDRVTFNYTGRPGGDNSTFKIGVDDGDDTTWTKEVAVNLVGRVRASDN